LDVRVQADTLVIHPDKRWQAQPVIRLLTDGLLLPTGFINRLFVAGKVYLGPRPATRQDLVGRQRLRLLGGIEEEAGVNPTDTTPPAEVLYQDEHLLIVAKPPNLLVHPGTVADSDTLAHRVARVFQLQGLRRRVRHVHRLDYGTSGAVLYAAHAYAARALDHLLLGHHIHRFYLAIVHGRPPRDEGLIEQSIGRDRHVAGRYRVAPRGKPATTHYQVLAARPYGEEWLSLVACQLETGRTHQIRVHLSHLGCPIVGDELYGGGTGPFGEGWPEGYALHALHLGFVHPYTGQPLICRAPLPPSWRAAMSVFPELDSQAEDLTGQLGLALDER
jgi:23S rRNA pseudouridine1911/1915/1917 synthase